VALKSLMNLVAAEKKLELLSEATIRECGIAGLDTWDKNWTGLYGHNMLYR
jgi:hypothetical protein